MPIGYVGMHGTEADDPDQWVGAAWTSPGEGTVNITGGVWMSYKSHIGRNSDWQIRLNNEVITSGNVSYDDAYSSSSPFYFYLASGGPSALSDLFVQKGDIISLEFKSHTSWATFVGMEFIIDYSKVPLLFTAVSPCRIVDTRNTSAGIIDASTQRDFRVYRLRCTISAQGGNPAGCPSPVGEPLAAHINMVAVDPTGKGNLQAFPVGAGTGSRAVGQLQHH